MFVVAIKYISCVAMEQSITDISERIVIIDMILQLANVNGFGHRSG